MKINLSYDRNILIEEEDLLGDIRILSENGTIEEWDTYIDSWLFSLINLYNSFKDGKNKEVDLVEEPAPLVGIILNCGFAINYKKQKIIFVSLDEFKKALKIASAKVINDFITPSVTINSEIYRKIFEFGS